VQDISNVYSVDGLRPVFYFNTMTNKDSIGFIAHEVQEKIPFLVDGIKDGQEIQRLNYEGLIGILVNEVQKLQKENTKLFADNRTINEEIQNIKRFIGM
jgi:acyl-[acyl carrier protein]--UDP-N-acetylglucosamine O-acyltransferase